MQNDIKKISELITLYSDRLGLSKGSAALDIYSSWATIVGEKYAAHSKLIDIKHQTAILETDHPGWSQQILLNKRHIIRNFQKKYPQLEVKDISVMVVSAKEYNKNGAADSLKINYHDNKQPIKSFQILPFSENKQNISAGKSLNVKPPRELQVLLAQLGKTIAENEKAE